MYSGCIQELAVYAKAKAKENKAGTKQQWRLYTRPRQLHGKSYVFGGIVEVLKCGATDEKPNNSNKHTINNPTNAESGAIKSGREDGYVHNVTRRVWLCVCLCVLVCVCVSLCLLLFVLFRVFLWMLCCRFSI